MVVAIVGAGASGMAAALAAAENPMCSVLLFERQARVGRKLQATGNGRCNLSNLHAAPEHYHGEMPDFTIPAMQQYDVQKTLQWFADLGLYTVAEDSGRVYPYSDQANSVVDILRFALDKPNISLITGCEIRKVKKDGKQFVLESDQENYCCDKLLVACGGLAGTKLGGSMSGYQLLRSFGHHITKLRPNLVQIKTDWPGVTALKGVRANCRVQILHNGKLWAESRGELQFTEYGLSGPVIFEVSRDVCSDRGDWTAELDFMTNWTEDNLLCALKKRKATNLPADELLTGILHNRLGRVLTKAAGINGSVPISVLEQDELLAICKMVKSFAVSLKEPLGMDAAQVTAGGIYTTEFDSGSLESRLVPGLYACGEVLDVDGDCGGYNLQWAWSSGRLAGTSASELRNPAE